jgi:hypothetical protein
VIERYGKLDLRKLPWMIDIDEIQKIKKEKKAAKNKGGFFSKTKKEKGPKKD